MAQLDPIHSRGDNPRYSPRTHTIQQLIRVDEVQNGVPQPHPSSTISLRSQEVIHDPEDSHNPPKKLTVIAKVKEKARRWKLNFSKKKKHIDDNSTPSWGVSLEDDDDEEPEYLGAPSNLYESELAPELCKGHARQHPRDHIVSEKHVLQSSVSPDTTSVESQDKMIDLKNQYQSELVSKDSEMEKDNVSNDTNKHDTREANKDVLGTAEGVSVKEFIKRKLEPGDDEKALSEVISDAMSPRKSTTAGSVVEIFKGAVNSLLWREDPFQSSTATNSSSISNNEPIVEEEQLKQEYSTVQTN